MILTLSKRQCVFFLCLSIFLETEMTWDQPIIVRRCIFKNQNLCFALRQRVKAE